jgi:hypothetical protein
MQADLRFFIIALAVTSATGCCIPVESLNAQPHPVKRPTELVVLPEGRLLRVQLADGRVLFARMASAGEPLHLAFADGAVAEVPRDAVLRIRTVRGSMRNGRFWAEDSHHPGLLTGSLAAALVRSAPAEAGHGRAPPVASLAPETTLLTSTASGRYHTLIAGVAGAEPRRDSPTYFVGAGTRLLALRRFELDLGATLSAAAGDALRVGAAPTLSARWRRGEDTEVQLGLGVALRDTPEAIARADVTRRLSRHWAVAVDAARIGSEPVQVAAGVRLLADPLWIDAGVRFGNAGSPESTLGPALQLSYRC